MKLNITKLLRDYRAACRAVGINPRKGPATFAESRKAIRAFRQRDPKNPLWWQAVDWLDDEGSSHSETEYLALLRVWIEALHAMFVDESEVFVMSENHRVALRELLALRGETLEWVVDEDGEIVVMVLPLDDDDAEKAS